MKKEGIVEYIENDIVTIRICTNSACHGCSAKLLCGVSKDKDKLIDCYCSTADQLNVGDNVTVQISGMSSFRAVLIAYIIPTIVLVGSLFMLVYLGYEDGLAAVLSILFLALYYGAVFIFQHTLKDRIFFRIVKK